MPRDACARSLHGDAGAPGRLSPPHFSDPLPLFTNTSMRHSSASAPRSYAPRGPRHATVLIDADARGPSMLTVGEERLGRPVGAEEDVTARVIDVRQTLHDPAGHHDWVIEAVVDCDASDESGSLVLATAAMRRL